MRRLLPLVLLLVATVAGAAEPPVATFSIVAADPQAGEVGVAVASRFFAVGSVVPWARADVGAVATQSFANTSFGPRGLDLLESGLAPAEVVKTLLRNDDQPARRQVGVVSADGHSTTYSGDGCLNWAGGRSGPNYAVQGNILAGDQVVKEMERVFLATEGQPLAERMLAALLAGNDAGGDSRGKQSAAIVVARAGGGYGGYTDRAIDIRVDDAEQPFKEIERLLGLAMVNDYWNRGWTAFTKKQFEQARRWQEIAAERALAQPTMLPEVLYDLAVIRLAAGDHRGAQLALDRAIELNPKLRQAADDDSDLTGLRESPAAVGATPTEGD